MQRKQFQAETETIPIEGSEQTAPIFTPKKYDVVIVGAGIAGLTAAVEASLAGKTVLLIESREERVAAIRPQLIYLQLENTAYLGSLNARSSNAITAQDILLFEDNPLIEHYGIKDIQRFLKRKIDNKFCSFKYESKVAEIDLDQGSLLVAKKNDQLQQERIEFEYLVLADGAKHQTADLLSPHIGYQPIPDRPEKKHIAANFIVEAKDDDLDNLTYPNALAVLSHDNYCGYLYYENAINRQRRKVGIVMHVSDQQFEKYKVDPESGIAFLKHCVASAYAPAFWNISMPKSKKYGIEKDRLKYAAFSLEFAETMKPAFRYKGKKVILVGDSRRNADFYLGHGGNDAIRDGKLAGRVIKKEISIGSFSRRCYERSKEISNDTINFQPILDHYLRTKEKYAKYRVDHYDADTGVEKQALVSPQKFGMFASSGKSDAVSLKENKDKNEVALIKSTRNIT